MLFLATLHAYSYSLALQYFNYVYCIFVYQQRGVNLKGALNSNFLNLTINREKFCL